MTPEEIARWLDDRRCRSGNDPDCEGCPVPDDCECAVYSAIASAIRAERERAEKAEAERNEARRRMKATVPISGDGQYVLIDGFGDQWIDYDDERLKRATAAEAERDRLREALERIKGNQVRAHHDFRIDACHIAHEALARAKREYHAKGESDG